MEEVEKYLVSISKPQADEYARIRKIVKNLVPDTSEVISYGIPTFKLGDKVILHFGAFKNHVSIFPGSKPVALLGDKLKGYEISKGTIKYSTDKPIPESLLNEIIALNLK